MPETNWTPAQLESSLTELRSIVSARVVLDDRHAVREVHALMAGDRNPKQVVRDIESTLLARFGVSVNHKAISVAQLGPEIGVLYRLRWLDVALSQEGRRASARVTLERSGSQFVGAEDGHRSSLNALRLVAGATIRAVEQAFGLEDRFALQDIATSVTLAERRVVVVMLTMVTDRAEEVLTGSAVVQQNDVSRAVVHATLDALNRRVQWMPSESMAQPNGIPAEGGEKATIEN